jgi:hypothetical protein
MIGTRKDFSYATIWKKEKGREGEERKREWERKYIHTNRTITEELA